MLHTYFTSSRFLFKFPCYGILNGMFSELVIVFDGAVHVAHYFISNHPSLKKGKLGSDA